MPGRSSTAPRPTGSPVTSCTRVTAPTTASARSPTSSTSPPRWTPRSGGAELALGDGPGRIYQVEPVGQVENDPNLTDQRFPGNPTRSYRTRDPLRVVAEVTSWQ